jgi:hypothetical protein
MKHIEPTSFSIDYVPSRSPKHHQQIDEEQTHIHGTTKTATIKKTKSPNRRDMEDYDNLENVTKTKRKPKTEQKVKENLLIKIKKSFK